MSLQEPSGSRKTVGLPYKAPFPVSESTTYTALFGSVGPSMASVCLYIPPAALYTIRLSDRLCAVAGKAAKANALAPRKERSFVGFMLFFPVYWLNSESVSANDVPKPKCGWLNGDLYIVICLALICYAFLFFSFGFRGLSWQSVKCSDARGGGEMTEIPKCADYQWD